MGNKKYKVWLYTLLSGRSDLFDVVVLIAALIYYKLMLNFIFNMYCEAIKYEQDIVDK